jgi:hypothetical protein
MRPSGSSAGHSEKTESNILYKNLYGYVNINKSGSNFKGIVSRNKYFFNAFNNQKVLSIHVLIVFILFCFLVKEKTLKLLTN